jgi:gas vesicle protein
MSDNGYSGSTVLFAFVAGAAAGAVVALLTAPKSGRETREDLKELGASVAGKARQLPGAVREAYVRASAAAVDAFKESFDEAGGRSNA